MCLPFRKEISLWKLLMVIKVSSSGNVCAQDTLQMSPEGTESFNLKIHVVFF